MANRGAMLLSGRQSVQTKPASITLSVTCGSGDMTTVNKFGMYFNCKNAVGVYSGTEAKVSPSRRWGFGSTKILSSEEGVCELFHAEIPSYDGTTEGEFEARTCSVGAVDVVPADKIVTTKTGGAQFEPHIMYGDFTYNGTALPNKVIYFSGDPVLWYFSVRDPATGALVSPGSRTEYKIRKSEGGQVSDKAVWRVKGDASGMLTDKVIVSINDVEMVAVRADKAFPDIVTTERAEFVIVDPKITLTPGSTYTIKITSVAPSAFVYVPKLKCKLSYRLFKGYVDNNNRYAKDSDGNYYDVAYDTGARYYIEAATRNLKSGSNLAIFTSLNVGAPFWGTLYPSKQVLTSGDGSATYYCQVYIADHSARVKTATIQNGPDGTSLAYPMWDAPEINTIGL